MPSHDASPAENRSDAPTRNLAACYVRSACRSPEELSVDRQYGLIMRCAASLGLEMPDDPRYRFEDRGWGGHSTGRSGLRRLRDHVESGAATFSCIIVKESTRIGRFEDPRVLLQIRRRLASFGVSIRCAEEAQVQDLGTAGTFARCLAASLDRMFPE